MKNKKGYKRKTKKYFKRKTKIHKFGSPVTIIRHRYVTTITASDTVPLYGALSFKLSDLPNFTEFTSLYDEYHILKVVLTFIPGRATQVYNINQLLPDIVYVVDHDDMNVPVAGELLQYEYCKYKSMGKQFTVTFKPRLAVQVYQSLISTAYSSKSQYVDCAFPDVPHYGFKYYTTPSGLPATSAYDIYAKFIVSFRGVR